MGNNRRRFSLETRLVEPLFYILSLFLAVVSEPQMTFLELAFDVPANDKSICFDQYESHV